MSEGRHTGKYPIGTVARVTGISAHTLRVWERRYSAVAPARTPGGSRVYSDADIDKLLLLKKLTALGHAIGRIAHLPEDELRAMAAPGAAPGPPLAERLPTREAADTIRRELMAALEELDVGAGERMLLYAASFFEPRELLLHVVAPIAEQIGTRWAQGTLRIAHEHAASALLRNLLGTMIRATPLHRGGATAVAATPSGELHELGALMAAIMTMLHGWRVVYLGTGLPAGEIAYAVEQCDASALLLSVVNAPGEDTARELDALLRALPEDVRLIVGGRSARAYAHLLARATVAADLADLEPLLTRVRH